MRKLSVQHKITEWQTKQTKLQKYKLYKPCLSLFFTSPPIRTVFLAPAVPPWLRFWIPGLQHLGGVFLSQLLPSQSAWSSAPCSASRDSPVPPHSSGPASSPQPVALSESPPDTEDMMQRQTEGQLYLKHLHITQCIIPHLGFNTFALGPLTTYSQF